MYDHLIKLNTPEVLAARFAAHRAKGGDYGRPAGQPDGMTKKEYLALREVALVKKQKVMDHMAATDPFISDNEVAHKALGVAVEILMLPGAHQLRLQAAKTLLEYTQRKPVAASAVTLSTAESFLDSIVNDDTPADSNSQEA